MLVQFLDAVALLGDAVEQLIGHGDDVLASPVAFIGDLHGEAFAGAMHREHIVVRGVALAAAHP